MDEIQLPNVAILSSPRMGHLIPCIELAKRFLLHHNITVTFITISDGYSLEIQNDVKAGLPDKVRSVVLPPVSLDDLPQEARVEGRACIAIKRSLPNLRNVLETLASTTPLVALVVDLFGAEAIEVAKEVGVSSYLYFPSTFMGLSFLLNLPTLDATFLGEYRDLPEPLKFPGCVPIPPSEMPDALSDRSCDGYAAMLNQSRLYKEAEGVLVNSLVDLEPEAVKALKSDGATNPPVYPIGPLVRTGTGNTGGADWAKWLDEQPRGSVLFVCFGSGGVLSLEQLNELAFGLEMSGQRFLWVVRSPHKKEANAKLFAAQSIDDPFDYLPQGFLSRTKGLGFVVSSWVPQVEVLSHGSTGGFVSHCGWNSSLESIVHGIPMIAWPLYAEQKMNALLLVEDLKVALRPKAGDGGLIEREDIVRVAKELIEGEEGKELKKTVQKLKEASALALEEGGSSYKALSNLACKLKSLK
ncbi:hydroquinone glucosyltransferase-like [Tasmannia lanceolata]|uniref:hydroquinone glucosyltransferase-like n=1 Tax=Tasmannia lanceolata TaxID=3420 RepID=UPI004063F009